jgi:sugar/nucleoside kinase (ribokinase family)
VSKDYIRKKLELAGAAEFFKTLRTLWQDDWRPRAIVCPWGADGVYYMDGVTHAEHHAATTSLDQTVDSVGAGDTFIGTALAAFAHSVPLHDTVRVACRVATAKCGQHGFRLSSELRDEVVSLLQTHGQCG